MGGRSSEVADRLRAEILSGAFAPGAALREFSLAERFAVSRRTIREALLVLSAEGLAVHRHNQGASVKKYDEADIRDLYRVRRILEAEGARCSVSASDEQLQRVSDAFDALARAAENGLTSQELAWADAGFHGAVIALANSPRVDEFYEKIASQMAFAIMILQRDDAVQSRRIDRVVAEHRAIYDAVRNRDAYEAQGLILAHIAHHEHNLLSLVTGSTAQTTLPRPA